MLTLLPRSGGATGRAETRGRLLKWIRERSPRLKRKHGRNGNTTFVINERKNVPAGMKQRQNRPRASWMHLFPARRNTHIYGVKAFPRLVICVRPGAVCCSFQSGIYREPYKACNISPRTGQSVFSTGGKVQGGHFIIPGKSEKPLALCEGYATGASIHLAVNCTVYVTFSANNLPVVANLVRHRFPEASILICGDNDEAAAVKGRKLLKQHRLDWSCPSLPPARGKTSTTCIRVRGWRKFSVRWKRPCIQLPVRL